MVGPVTPSLEDPALAATAAGLPPSEPGDETTWNTLAKAVSAATGAKGRALFHPLRLELTGRGDGPALKQLLPLLGPARALAGLKGATA